MPYSFDTFDEEVRGYVLQHFPDRLTPILDIGAGAGKYGKLLPEYGNIDAVEAFEPYVDRFELRRFYRKVIVADIVAIASQLAFGDYRLAIIGDILEHLTTTDARAVLDALLGAGCRLLVIVPYLYDQGECEGNPLERHQQPDLTPELMNLRYPRLELIFGDSVSGVYAA
jgi:hypothetical protein